MASTLLNIAVVYHRQGKYDEALDLYQKAERVYIAVYGYAHPDVATSEYNLGDLFAKHWERG